MTTTTITRISIIDGTASIMDGAGAGDACDEDATLDAYVQAVTDELTEMYPGVDVSYRWEHSNRDTDVEHDGDENEDARIREALERVWERGAFWIAA